jgi:hypothetical protein
MYASTYEGTFKVTWRETAWIHQMPLSEAPGPGAYDLLAVDRLTWARVPAPKFGKEEQVRERERARARAHVCSYAQVWQGRTVMREKRVGERESMSECVCARARLRTILALLPL